MSKKFLILSRSPRNGGNSDIFCDEFMKGAKEAGNERSRFIFDNCRNSLHCLYNG